MHALSKIEIVPGVGFVVVKLISFWMQEPYPDSDFITFPFHRTQLLFPMTRGLIHDSVTGGTKLDIVDVKLLFVTITYDQPSTIIAFTKKAK